MMKYKVVLFDADDTLFDFKKSETHAFMKTMTEYEEVYDESIHLKAYHDINTRIWKEFEMGEITQKELKVERFRRLREALGMSFHPEEFAKRYMHHLSYASFVYPDAERLMEELKGKFKMAIITNGLTQVQTRRIRNAPLAKYFQDVIISEEIGVSKPSPQIFVHALEKLGHADAGNVLMIGDSLTSDIKGGEDFGMDTCWFNPEGKENRTAVNPTYEVRTLMDILDIL